MANNLVIIGCGGFGREVVGIVDAINSASPTSELWKLVGFLDDSPSVRDAEAVERLSLSVLGPVVASSINSPSPTYFVVGIGSGAIRQKVAQRAEGLGLIAATLIHPSASVGRDVSVGVGTIIAANSHVTTNVTLGDHVHIDRGSQIGHDSNLGRFVTSHPMAVVSGGCQLDDLVELGTNCAIMPGISVGAESIVGAGACVVQDVGAGLKVKGVPAR